MLGIVCSKVGVTFSPTPCAAQGAAVAMATNSPNYAYVLRGLWTLHVIGALDDQTLDAALRNPDDRVRSWAIRLGTQEGALVAAVIITAVFYFLFLPLFARCLKYFPRLVIPLAVVFTSLFNLTLNLVVAFVFVLGFSTVFVASS